MRAVVVRESVKEPRLLEGIPGREISRYPLALNGQPVEIIEIEIPEAGVFDACLQLADALLPKLYFAQIQDSERMFVMFPNSISLVGRGDVGAERAAQNIGSLFGIPASQMRFLDMFATTHPDILDA